MLEVEFVDRSVALAGKAFVSFFPLVIVVAAFMPTRVRTSILTTMTYMLGIRGHALETVRAAFASADDVRRATGILGLVLTIFFASAFTTSLQRLYLRVWRRAPQHQVGVYTLGAAWLPAMLVYLAVLGGWRGLWGDGAGVGVRAVVLLGSALATSGMWWFTAWFMLSGNVRWRVLLPTGLITGLAMFSYALSSTIWMPEMVRRNDHQFGLFGVALALVTWLSGAALCILAGACAGPVLAEDDGALGSLVRGREPRLLVEGAAPPLPPPDRAPHLRDAFRPTPEGED
jgi:membrane protein